MYICRVIKKSFANLSHFNEILWQSDLIICNLTYEFRLWAHNSGRFDKSPPTFKTKYQVNDCFIPKRSFILKYAPITVTSFLEILQNTWNVGVYFYKDYGHMIVFFLHILSGCFTKPLSFFWITLYVIIKEQGWQHP